MADTIDKTVTVIHQVASADGDAEQALNGLGFDASGVALSCTYHGAPATQTVVGLRFTNIVIPQAATIESASLAVYVTGDDDPKLTIHGEDADDSVVFSASARIVPRAKTTATVAWVDTAIGAGWQSPADLKTVLQEIVDRSGWREGHALSLLLRGDLGAGGPLTLAFRSYDGEPTEAAKLTIAWTLATPIGGVIAPPPAWLAANTLKGRR